MPPLASSSLILRFDDDLQAEARTVLARSTEPQNALRSRSSSRRSVTPM